MKSLPKLVQRIKSDVTNSTVINAEVCVTRWPRTRTKIKLRNINGKEKKKKRKDSLTVEPKKRKNRPSMKFRRGEKERRIQDLNELFVR